jgi:hypothetical protein
LGSDNAEERETASFEEAKEKASNKQGRVIMTPKTVKIASKMTNEQRSKPFILVLKS